MEPADKFTFLDANTQREPHILEVLAEMDLLQRQSLPTGMKQIATLDSLKKSRNIKIPFSPNRDSTIEYLLELLVSRFPEYVKPVITFDFRVEEGTKRLTVLENMEFTVNPGPQQYEIFCSVRDARSTENLLGLLRRFRFFNLTKLMRITKSKADLARVIKKEEDKQIYIFKNYSLDKNKMEMSEDFCFHTQNYASVRDSLNLNNIQDIISRYNELVARRLKNFGILNTYFSDYHDSKLDYILNILVNDLPTVLAASDLIAAKNVQSLRFCLLRVEEELDPLLTLGKDITRCVNENRVCSSADLVATVLNLTQDMLEKWSTPENLGSHSIISHVDGQGIIYYIDKAGFVNSLIEMNDTVLRQPEKMASMSYTERQAALKNLDVMLGAAHSILSSPERIKDLGLEENEIEALRRVLDEQKARREYTQAKQETQRTASAPARRRSIIEIIIDFFRRLFSRKTATPAGPAGYAAAPARQESQETRDLMKKVAASRAPVQVLSDYITLTQENGNAIDRVINDLREMNFRIVIPVYNAREVLYPVRSQKVLMGDVDYVLVAPEVVRNPESIRKFTDDLVGFKVKEEILPAKAIVLIEKYLLTHYRQKRAQMLKKEL